MSHTVFIVSLLFASTVSLSPSKRYRLDYEYDRGTNAFYKLHIESENWSRAEERCATEGGHLVVPSTLADTEPAHGLFKKYVDLGKYLWVGTDGLKHDSAEEAPIIDLNSNSGERVSSSSCEVLTRKGEVETMPCDQRLPYVCKVLYKDAVYDKQCGVYGTTYVYFASVHSCYLVPPMAMTWNEAYAECRAQGAHLAVLNSQAEAQTVADVVTATARIPDAKTSYFFFVGIRAHKPAAGLPRVFNTIFNETLEQAGYSTWSDGEPNNYKDLEYCGSIFKNNARYNDVDCSDKYGFVCEKEVSVS